MFQVGELVCYPMHGVGVVEAIEEQTVLGESAQYYQLRFVMGRMTAMVPVKTAESVGLRRLVDLKTCEEVVSFLREGDCSSESENWNQRYRENLDKLRGGDIFTVADVVKCLMCRDKAKGLSAGERKMYLTARQVLIAELAAASGREESEFLPLVGG
ncbi:MAG: CarD family transcriptional regulator [Clostridia bacterium]|nr:CarD family transcriptional regulator [Clostridia bacterium]